MKQATAVSRTFIGICLAIWGTLWGYPGTASSDPAVPSANTFSPESTVLLAGKFETRFCQDYSPLLKYLRLEWVIPDEPIAPDAVRDKNVIVLGHPDTGYVGDIITSIMTANELDNVSASAGSHEVLEKDSPWAEDRSIFICIGENLISLRDAAESALRSVMQRSPPASSWTKNRYESQVDENVDDYVSQFLFTWDDAEMPLDELAVDADGKSRGSVSTSQASEDVDRLFYLLSHGYSGYAFFGQNGEFDRAKEDINERLTSRARWSVDDFSRLLHEELGFVTDLHLKIGDYQYGRHYDFWYDTSLELTLHPDGFRFESDGTAYKAKSADGQTIDAFVFPSLNSNGDPVYRLGVLSKEKPAPLSLLGANDEGNCLFEIQLRRSDFDYYSNDIFREDNIGGIPVVRVRSFGDTASDALEDFVEAGFTHQNDPVVIVDARGNGGGNEVWPVSFIQALTGERAESVFISAELHSKTTLTGRANTFMILNRSYPRNDLFRNEAERYGNLAASIERGISEARWVGPYYPRIPLIANDATIAIVMNGMVASAGEGLIMRASQAENVILVGENTMGALTFGNVSTHQLPNSGLAVSLPINFGLFQDLQFREEEGLAPDLWVPAEDAVNYTVAALRNGTLSTYRPLSSETLQHEFIPENPAARLQKDRLIRGGLAAMISLFALVWAYKMRSKRRVVAVAAALWLGSGAVFLVALHNSIGYAFLAAGVVCLASIAIGVFNAKIART